ncbi:MAG TPA: hypothetical protein PL187_06275 [Caldilinea sp.]|nr:hypothetical protein [Caldilinea sp.]
MFPEGTRRRNGKGQRGRSGAAFVAIQAQAPLAPAAVVNSEPLFHRTNYLSLKPRVKVMARVGKPLSPHADPHDRRALRTYTRDILDAIADLLPPSLRANAPQTEGEEA